MSSNKILKEIIIIVLLGIFFGFIVGSFYFFIFIIENQYIQYKMLRLVAFNFQNFLNKWVIITINLFIILWLLFFISKLIWKSFFSNIVEINNKVENKKYIYIIYISLFIKKECSYRKTGLRLFKGGNMSICIAMIMPIRT